MPRYLDDAQREQLQEQRATWRWRSAWPTWLVIVAVYSGWFGVALHARTLGLPVTLTLLAVLSCWYMSLQHELLHGHPTRWPLVNMLFGLAPLAVWFPYAVYRDSHLRHHDDAHLTEPGRDPESYYVTPEQWANAGVVLRAALAARNTFLGRVLIGPWFSIAASWREAAQAVALGQWRIVASWLVHAASLAALAWWLDARCGIPWRAFLFGVGYASLALASVRSFQEHRAEGDARERTVLNEAAWPWRLLFLNNNYHSVHHDLPGVPWFALGAVYRQRREAYGASNGGFVVRGYGEWIKKHAFARAVSPVHPFAGGTRAPVEWIADTAVTTRTNAMQRGAAKRFGQPVLVRAAASTRDSRSAKVS
ncbi:MULTISPECIES: fatty acid desaturase [unclassified Caballeronia]|jgi:fatty acid desaturase|uniref:fatty acid desaturase n=1 Tax=unclassified Caballeronia TaxID=2646786 RepID=UPI00202842A0|nr:MULTISPECIES: fatty acid desaturase [unclassified Caballeronia]MDR5802091.1 fatty acid desaturase [Caballeronia sp. LZ001]